MTIDEVATKLNVSRVIAYGFVRFLEQKGLVTTTGGKRPPGTRGKAPKVYALKADAAAELTDLLKDFVK